MGSHWTTLSFNLPHWEHARPRHWDGRWPVIHQESTARCEERRTCQQSTRSKAAAGAQARASLGRGGAAYFLPASPALSDAEQVTTERLRDQAQRLLPTVQPLVPSLCPRAQTGGFLSRVWAVSGGARLTGDPCHIYHSWHLAGDTNATFTHSLSESSPEVRNLSPRATSCPLEGAGKGEDWMCAWGVCGLASYDAPQGRSSRDASTSEPLLEPSVEVTAETCPGLLGAAASAKVAGACWCGP